jgi:hypothetical protein
LTDVSRARGAQTEVAAVARRNGFFAASNDTLLRTIRIYRSNDGRTWTSTAGPPLEAGCARGDPSVAAAPDGREYVAIIVNSDCLEFDPNPYRVVASHAARSSTWSLHRLTPRSSEHWDDKPVLAAAADGRIYAVWTRLLNRDTAAVVVSSSADHGRTWSHPKPLSGRLDFGQLVAATVAPDGTLYVAGVDSYFGIWAARSTPGGRFVVKQVYALTDSVASTCMLSNFRPIPTQSNRCLGPDPTIAVAGPRVFVTFAGGQPYSTDGVTVATLDRSLHLVSRKRVGATKPKTAQFWPASAVDPARGRLWVCYYDTSGDPSSKQAWYVCTSSRDGRHWTTPVRTSSFSANVESLWEDARIYGFGDEIGYGGYTAVVAAHGAAHPLWVDTRDLEGRQQEILTARLAAP